jgi:transposase InsO family protein
VVTHFLPHLNRDAVYRILKAEGLGRLPPADRARRSHSRFKDYDLGFVHVDVKHLPKLRTADGQSRKRYLYVAIDRASRFVHLAVKDDETERSAVAFLTEAIRAFPFQVTHVLTDRGSCFTADGFEAACQKLGVEHRKTRPYTPRTNGMVERFNGRVQREVLGITGGPATRIWKPCCTASIRPTTLVGNACSRAAHPRGSCPSASPRSPPTLTPVTIRHSIPAACPRPFR